MRTTKLLLSLFFLITAAIITLKPVYSASFQGVSVLPANPDPKVPFSDSWFIYNLLPGETRQDEVVVKNSSTETVRFKIYAVDATTTNDGAFALLDETAKKNSIGLWTALNTNAITLSPGQNKKIKFTIAVPQKVLPGDYLGGIIIENLNIKKGEGGLNVKTRVGVRIYQTTPGELIKKLILKDLTWQVNKEGKIVFIFELANKGNVRIEPQGSMIINNNLLATQQTLPINLHMVLPEKDTTVPVVFNKTPIIGMIKAQTTIKYGELPSEKIVNELSFLYVSKTFKIISGSLLIVAIALFAIKPKRKKK